MFNLSGLFKIVLPRRRHLRQAGLALEWPGWRGIRTFVAFIAILITVQVCQDTREQRNHAYELDQDRLVRLVEQLGVVLAEMQKAQQRSATRYLEYPSSSWESQSRPNPTSSQTPAWKSAWHGASASTWLARLNGGNEKETRGAVLSPTRDLEILRNARGAQVEGSYCVGIVRSPGDLSRAQGNLPDFLQAIIRRGRGG